MIWKPFLWRIIMLYLCILYLHKMYQTAESHHHLCHSPKQTYTLNQRANDPETFDQSEILHTPKRKQCDDYDSIFLQKFTQMQEVNINNACTTGDQIKVLVDAATKVATAAGIMATVAQETQEF